MMSAENETENICCEMRITDKTKNPPINGAIKPFIGGFFVKLRSLCFINIDPVHLSIC